MEPPQIQQVLESLLRMLDVVQPGADQRFKEFCGTRPPKCEPPQREPQPCEPNEPIDMSDCFPPDLQDCFPGADPQPKASGKTFDVWFEHQDGQKAKQRSPIVLDLNGNGRPDLTGNVVLENGRYVAKGSGKVDFDIDPTKRSWKTKSLQRRPGRGAPKVENGTAKVYDAAGKLIADNVPLKDAMKNQLRGGKNGIQEGRVEVYDQNGQLAGEYKKDEKSGKMMYHFGGRLDAEKTEWMGAGGGDALLAWDVNGDGKIDSSKELFGEFDIDGTQRFANGYEKLAEYFDVNKDGKVEGDELRLASDRGVRVWKDENGDAKTDAGELTTLDANKLRSLGVQFDPTDLSSTYSAE